MQRHVHSVCLLFGRAFLCGLLGWEVLLASSALAEEPTGFVKLTIPLEQGRWYSVRQLRGECQRTFGTSLVPLEQDDRRELSGVERAALLLAQEAGLLAVRFEPNCLVLWVPNTEEDGTRRASRRRLERLLGLSLGEWPTDLGLHVPESFDPAQRTVLLIHGLGAGGTDLTRLTDACRATGFQTLLFDYPNDGPLAWSGDRLRSDLKRFVLQYPTARLVVIAHSMGGLVIRHCLEAPEAGIDGITDVFFLGTPHQGSSVVAAGDLWRMADDLPRLSSLDEFRHGLLHGLGEARVDLLPNSAFLRTLNARQRPVGVRYHLGIGTGSFVTQEQYEVIAEALSRRLAHPNLSSDLRGRWQQLIEAPELKPGIGDGAVSVQSARLPDVASERIFELNHLELKDLPGVKPEESELFRWIVQVLHYTPRATP